MVDTYKLKFTCNRHIADNIKIESYNYDLILMLFRWPHWVPHLLIIMNMYNMTLLICSASVIAQWLACLFAVPVAMGSFPHESQILRTDLGFQVD